jgi:hypothetical protein
MLFQSHWRRRELASANAAGELTGCESQQAELAAVNSLLAISQVIQSGSKTALNAERGLSTSSDAQRELFEGQKGLILK